MSKMIRGLLGTAMLVAGFVVWGQALGAGPEGPLTGSTFWTFAGPVIAGLGLALLVVTFQKRDGDPRATRGS